jgi:diguanylate cyclase (GGDEF)-like protein
VRIGASVGICCYPTDGRNAAELLRLADRAMYAAKDQGRAGWRSHADLSARDDGA